MDTRQAVGGLLVDGDNFDWPQAYEKTGRFAKLCEPYEGFYGMVFSEEKTVAYFSLHARRKGLRVFGAVISPHNTFAILQVGLEILGLHMERHVANTRKVVEFLATVESVAYPELPSHRGLFAHQDPAAKRLWRGVLMPSKGRPRYRTTHGKIAQDIFLPSQCRRCQVVSNLSGLNHPHLCAKRTAGSGGIQGRHAAPIDRTGKR